MKLDEVVRELSLEVAAGSDRLDSDVTGAYVGDLLSRAMAGVRPGNIWVTVQAHPNVVAVAVLGGLAGVVLAEGMAPDPAAQRKAEEEGMPVLTTPRSAYAICAALARLGIAESQPSPPAPLPPGGRGVPKAG